MLIELQQERKGSLSMDSKPNTLISRTKWYVLVFLLIIQFSANAQTCCTGAAPLNGYISLANPGASNWQFNAIVDFNSMQTLVQNNTKLQDDNLSRSTTSYILQSNYGFSERLGVSISIPFINLRESTTSVGQEFSVSNFGLGDIVITPYFVMLQKNKSIIQVGVGLKIPTGATQTLDEQGLFILNPTLQRGTGTTDYIFYLYGQKSMNFRPSMSIEQSVSTRINTTSTKLARHSQYKFGNELYLISTISDQYVMGSHILNPAISLSVRYAQNNFIEGIEDVNSGGIWVNLRAGSMFVLWPNLSVGFFGELPLYQNLNGFQLTTTYKIIGAVQLKF